MFALALIGLETEDCFQELGLSYYLPGFQIGVWNDILFGR